MLDYGLYRKIELLYRQHGVKICVDSAFKLGDRDFLIKSSQQDPIDNHQGVVLNWAATSLQQLSEHGIRLRIWREKDYSSSDGAAVQLPNRTSWNQPYQELLYVTDRWLSFIRLHLV